MQINVIKYFYFITFFTLFSCLDAAQTSRQGSVSDNANGGSDGSLICDPSGVCQPISGIDNTCLLYTSPSPRDGLLSRMPSSA